MLLCLALEHNIKIFISVFQSHVRLNVSGVFIERGLKAATSQVFLGGGRELLRDFRKNSYDFSSIHNCLRSLKWLVLSDEIEN